MDGPSFAVFPLFVALWLAVVAVLGLLAGHRELLARHPPVDEALQQLFRYASGRMRGVSFSGAIRVGIGHRGLHLAPAWPFRPIFWPGVPCIPWSEVELLEASPGGIRGWFAPTRLRIRSVEFEVRLFGKAGRAIEQKLGGAKPALVRHA